MGSRFCPLRCPSTGAPSDRLPALMFNECCLSAELPDRVQRRGDGGTGRRGVQSAGSSPVFRGAAVR